MKKEMCGCQPQTKIDPLELMMKALNQKRKIEAISKKYVRVEIVFTKDLDQQETTLIDYFVKKMGCNLKKMYQTKGSYILSGSKEKVEITENTLQTLQYSINDEVKVEWKHYRSLSESEQIAYADVIGAPKAYIKNRYIYNLIGRMKDRTEGVFKKDITKLS